LLLGSQWFLVLASCLCCRAKRYSRCVLSDLTSMSKNEPWLLVFMVLGANLKISYYLTPPLLGHIQACPTRFLAPKTFFIVPIEKIKSLSFDHSGEKSRCCTKRRDARARANGPATYTVWQRVPRCTRLQASQPRIWRQSRQVPWPRRWRWRAPN